MVKFLLWLVLFVLCWPLALAALVLYPLVWLLLLPFKLVGIAVEGAFSLLRAVVTLPARLISGRVTSTTWAPESDELMISTPVVINSVPVASASASPHTVEIRYRRLRLEPLQADREPVEAVARVDEDGRRPRRGREELHGVELAGAVRPRLIRQHERRRGRHRAADGLGRGNLRGDLIEVLVAELEAPPGEAEHPGHPAPEFQGAAAAAVAERLGLAVGDERQQVRRRENRAEALEVVAHVRGRAPSHRPSRRCR